MEIITGIEGTNKVILSRVPNNPLEQIKYGIPHLAISERFPNFAFSYYQIFFPQKIRPNNCLLFIPTHDRMQIQIYEYDNFAEFEEKFDLDGGFLEHHFQIGDWIKLPIKFVRIKIENFCAHPFQLGPGNPFQIPTIPLEKIIEKYELRFNQISKMHDNNFIEGMKILTEDVIINTKFTDLNIIIPEYIYTDPFEIDEEKIEKIKIKNRKKFQSEILRLSEDKDNWIKTKWKKQKENMGQIIKLIQPYPNSDKTEQAGRWENGKFIPRIFATDHEKRILFQDLIR